MDTSTSIATEWEMVDENDVTEDATDCNDIAMTWSAVVSKANNVRAKGNDVGANEDDVMSKGNDVTDVVPGEDDDVMRAENGEIAARKGRCSPIAAVEQQVVHADESAAMDAYASVSFDEEKDCLYHGKKLRGRLQQILNTSRKQGLLPSWCVNKIARLTCTCREHKGMALLEKKMNEVGEKSWRQSAFSSCARAELLSQINKLPVESSSLEQRFTGTDRLKYLLSEVYEGCFDIFKSLQASKPLIKEDETKPVVDTNIKKDIFKVPIPGNYIMYLYGREGRRIKQLSESHGCKVTIEYPGAENLPKIRMRRHGYWSKHHARVMKKYQIQSYVTGLTHVLAHVEADDEAKVKAAKLELLDLVQKIKLKRDMHNKRVESHYRAIVERQSQRQRSRRRKPKGEYKGVGLWGYASGMKEASQETFSKKFSHQGNGKSSTKPPPVLEDRHARCRYCMTPYTKEALAAECRYHGGYPIPVKKASGGDVKATAVAVASTSPPEVSIGDPPSHTWSCCGEDLHDTNVATQRRSHQESGCVEMVVHNFRPSRGPGGKRTKGGGRGRGQRSKRVCSKEARDLAAELKQQL